MGWGRGSGDLLSGGQGLGGKTSEDRFWVSGLGEIEGKKKGLHVATDYLERDWTPHCNSVQFQSQP